MIRPNDKVKTLSTRDRWNTYLGIFMFGGAGFGNAWIAWAGYGHPVLYAIGSLASFTAAAFSVWILRTGLKAKMTRNQADRVSTIAIAGLSLGMVSWSVVVHEFDAARVVRNQQCRQQLRAWLHRDLNPPNLLCSSLEAAVTAGSNDCRDIEDKA